MTPKEQKIADTVETIRRSIDTTDDQAFEAWDVIVSACDIALWTIREGLDGRALQLGYGSFLKDRSDDRGDGKEL